MALLRVTSCLSMGYQLATSYTITWNGVPGTVNAAGTNWFRNFLSPTGRDGSTQAKAFSLMSAVQTATANHVTVAMTANGYVGLTADASHTLQWDAGTVIGNLLGFTANSIALTSGVQALAPYPPTHAIMCVSREDSEYWGRVPQKFAGAELPDGSVYTVRDTAVRAHRRFTLRAHPQTWSLGSGLSYASPAFPDGTLSPSQASRWTTQSAAIPPQSPPWSLYDFFGTCDGYQLAGLFGTFQGWVAGTTTVWDECYVDLKTIAMEHPSMMMQPNYSLWFDWKDVGLWLVTKDQGGIS